MGKKLILAAMAFALVLSAGAAFAGEGRSGGPRGRFGHGPAFSGEHRMGRGFGRGMGRGGHGFGPRIMEELDLTDAQRAQMVDMMTANFREGLQARMEMADARRKMRELAESETFDDAAVIAANEALGAARGKLEVVGRKMADGFRALLTPEQQAKLDELKADRPDRFDRPGRDRFDRPGRPGRFDRDDDDDDDDDAPRFRRRPMPPFGRFGPGPRGMGCECE